MTERKGVSEKQLKDCYSDEEINELADWLEGLTLKQAFFLKESYEAHIQMQAHEQGSQYVQ